MSGETPATNPHSHGLAIHVKGVFVCFFVCVFVCLFVCVFVCLFVCLCVCLFVFKKDSNIRENVNSLHRILSSRYFILKKDEKLGHSVHKTRYFNSAVSATTQPDRETPEYQSRDFNNMETRAITKFFFFLQGKAPKEIHAILTETLGGTCTVVCHRHKLSGLV